jgi:outer membrane protein assembly factor BamD (BamD/ComL family)
MKRIILALSLLPVILLLAVGCQKKPSEDMIFNEAKKFQEESKYSEAVTSYEKLVKFHPRGKYAPQSQFMIGFILANDLKDIKRAEAAYKTFLEKYSSKADSGMVASAEWELKNLGKDINEIQDLSGIIQQETQTASDTAKTNP